MILTLGQLKLKLKEYLDDKITYEDLSEWAEDIEMDDNWDYKDWEDEEIAEIIFHLANPIINRKMSKEKMLEILKK